MTNPLAAPDLAELHATCFPDQPWDAKAFEAFLAQPSTHLVQSACRQAFALIQLVPPEAEILTLCVAPEARREGQARSLLQHLNTLCRTQNATHIFLEVAADNTAAQALYRHAGYAETGRRKAYYARSGAPAVDAVMMQRALTEG